MKCYYLFHSENWIIGKRTQHFMKTFYILKERERERDWKKKVVVHFCSSAIFPFELLLPNARISSRVDSLLLRTGKKKKRKRLKKPSRSQRMKETEREIW